MKEQVLRFIGAVFLTILALLGIGAVLHILVTLPLGGKGPEWIAAIGTVATLIGTIWLALGGDRKRKREQLDLAIIAAADLTLWIANLQRALRTAKFNLPLALNAPDDPRDACKVGVSTIENVGVWTREDLVPLVHLPRHTAARLAWAATKIRSVLGSLRLVSEADQLQDIKLLSFRTIMESQISACINELEGLQNECITFLGVHGFSGGYLSPAPSTPASGAGGSP